MKEKYEKELEKAIEFKNNVLTKESVIRQIEIMIKDTWGTKCEDYDPECALCRIWRVWEELKK